MKSHKQDADSLGRVQTHCDHEEHSTLQHRTDSWAPTPDTAAGGGGAAVVLYRGYISMVVSWMLQVVAVVSGQSEYTEAVEGWLSGTRDHGEGPGGGGC